MVIKLETSISKSVYDLLYNRIITKVYPPGYHITEDAVSSELSISRSPVRSSLRRLQEEGLVTHCKGKGFYVAISGENCRVLHSLRNGIDSAAAMSIVNRVLNRAPDEDYLLDEDEMITWPDNPQSAWYYLDMQEATNSHEYSWLEADGEKVEIWTEKIDERDWDALEKKWSSAYSG